jgi:hypothetical protein
MLGMLLTSWLFLYLTASLHHLTHGFTGKILYLTPLFESYIRYNRRFFPARSWQYFVVFVLLVSGSMSIVKQGYQFTTLYLMRSLDMQQYQSSTIFVTERGIVVWKI